MYFHCLKFYDNWTTIRCPNWTLKLKVGNSIYWKINFYKRKMSKYVGDGPTMSREFLLRSLMISQKKFSPWLAFCACQKKKRMKIAIMRKMSKKPKFGIWKVTPCYRLLQTTCAPELTHFRKHQPHFAQDNTWNTSNGCYRPEEKS